jgi:hypothetical protein
VQAVHLCGDQHLAVVVKHGIQEFGDGPYGFTSPALVNTIYGRWWHPPNAQELASQRLAGEPDAPLPWSGDFHDGLGNKITMLAYANPPNIADQRQRADGYGIVRFHKTTRRITFECWPRFADARRHLAQRGAAPDGLVTSVTSETSPNATKIDTEQFPGWPITIAAEGNDGRKPVAWLPELHFQGAENPVVQVLDEQSGDILYTLRVTGNRFQPAVFAPGRYTINIGRDRPDGHQLRNLVPREKSSAGRLTLEL